MDTFTVKMKLAREADAYWLERQWERERFQEPAEAIDRAEDVLADEAYAIPGEAFAEIFYNSDDEPHYRVFLLEPEREGQSNFGLFNTHLSKWEVIYPPGYGHNMPTPPLWFEEDEKGEDGTYEADEGEHKKDENADTMDLGGEDDEEDDFNDDDAEDEEGKDDDEIEVKDENGEDEIDEAEDAYEDTDDEDDSDSEEEKQLPRLKLFSKLRGPKGWRKRAESDLERDYNRFEFVVGVLNEDSKRVAGQERDKRVRVTVIERDENRATAELKIVIPEGMELDWKRPKGGKQTLTAEIPLHDHDDE